MSLINKSDVFDDDLVEAPLILSKNLEAAVASAQRLAAALAESSKTISSAKTVSELGDATKELTLAEQELLKIQNQIAVAEARNTDAYREKQQELENVKEATKKANQEAKLNKQIAEQQAGSIKKLELELKKNRLAYEQMSKAQRENSVEGKKLLATIQQQDKELKSLKASIGQNQLEVGNYKNAILEALGGLTGFNTGLSSLSGGIGTASKGITSFSTALRAIPIFLVIGAIVSLVSYFKKTEDGAMKLHIVMSAIGTVFDTLLDYVIGLGRSLSELSLEKVKQGFIDMGNAIRDFVVSRIQLVIRGFNGIGDAFDLLFKGEFKQAAQVAGKALADITLGIVPVDAAIDLTTDAVEKLGEVASKAYDDISDRVKKSIEVAKAENALLLKKRAFLIEEAKLNRIINESREEAADSELDSQARLDALLKAEKAVNDLFDKRIAIKKEENRLAQIRDDLAENDIKANDEAAQRQADLIQLEADRAAQAKTLTKQISALKKKIAEEDRQREINEIKKTNEEALAELQNRLDSEVKLIQDSAIRGEISKADAQKKIDALRKSMADDFIEQQIKGLKKLLGYKKLTAEEEKQIEDEIVKLKAKLNDALFDQIEEKNDEIVEDEKVKLDDIEKSYQDFANAFVSLFKSASDRRIAAIDAEIAKVDEQAKRELAIAGDNEEAKALINAEAERKREALEKKRKKERQEQARLEKIAAIIQATISVSKAVAEALDKSIPYAIAVGAIGAAQIKTIEAQPIPQFEKGTDSAPGGLAIVGEKGAELIKTKYGSYLSPSQASLVNLPKGAEVIPHDETMRVLAMAGMGKPEKKADGIVKELADLKKINSEIVNAIYETKTDIVSSGSMIYTVRKTREGNKEYIRKRIFG
jgi:hypothetical protein